jgi:MOSC domain-containing protein YiiM
MAQRGCPGFYLAVAQPGSVQAGQGFDLRPGSRGLSVRDAFAAKRVKHQR